MLVLIPMTIKFHKKTKMHKINDIINSENPVLVDFFATWCGPCQMLAPVLKQVKENLDQRITIIKIDVDKNQKLAQKHQVYRQKKIRCR